MRLACDYTFIFLIGYQTYFLLSLLTGVPANQWLSASISSVSLGLSAFALVRQNFADLRIQSSMALTTGILSLGTIAVFTFTHL